MYLIDLLHMEKETQFNETRVFTNSSVSFHIQNCTQWQAATFGIERVTLSKKCGTAPQTMEYLLVCPQMGQHCTHEDLAELNDSARHCNSYRHN